MTVEVRPAAWAVLRAPLCASDRLVAIAPTCVLVRAAACVVLSDWTCEELRPEICELLRAAMSLVLIAPTCAVVRVPRTLDVRPARPEVLTEPIWAVVRLAPRAPICALPNEAMSAVEIAFCWSLARPLMTDD